MGLWHSQGYTNPPSMHSECCGKGFSRIQTGAREEPRRGDSGRAQRWFQTLVLLRSLFVPSIFASHHLLQ